MGFTAFSYSIKQFHSRHVDNQVINLKSNNQKTGMHLITQNGIFSPFETQQLCIDVHTHHPIDGSQISTDISESV